jgi:hypothetical protein
MKALARPFGLALLLSAVPAFAAVTVTSPAGGASVTSPFTLTATASACSQQPIASMGYSFDSSAANTFFTGSSISTAVTGSTGAHTLHVKSWGNQGASCVTDVPITVVTAAPPPTTPVTNVAVSSPSNGATATSPFSLVAGGTLCSSQPISAFGYSLDSGATIFVNAQMVSTQVTATVGAHTLHVKSWGPQNAACDTDIALNVVAPAPVPSGPTIPANAIAVKAIQNLTTWKASFDAGTANSSGSASSSGTMALVTSPAVSGSARQFNTTYANYGGERYYTNFGADTVVTNFVYDTMIYLASPINDIANIEMDMNQVMANGQTVIFGFQCDGWSRSWDYTANTGSSPTSFNDQWLHTNQTCNPQAWATNTWHRVQVSYSRDSSGNVTYKTVWLDGVEQNINVTAPSAFALGWGSSLITNLQIDGMTGLPGTATVYLDNLTVYRW